MANHPRTYTDQFKQDALKLVETSGKPVFTVTDGRITAVADPAKLALINLPEPA